MCNLQKLIELIQLLLAFKPILLNLDLGSGLGILFSCVFL